MKNTSEDFTVIRKNAPTQPWIDFYHSWLVLSWPATIFLFLLMYIFGNLIFGFAYWLLGPGAIVNSNGTYFECFFFSVQTLATIGYGFMAPGTTACNLIVAVESATSVILMALMSGLFFGKFSQAKARLRFTKNMLIINYYGKPTLTFRMANDRANRIIDAQIRLTLLRQDTSPEGMRMRRFIELPLELSHPPLFAMSLTAMHVIEGSAIERLTVQEMCQKGYEFFVTIVGTDGTFGQTIHATKVYRAQDIITQGSWADIVEVLPNGTRVIDFKNFEVVNPI